MKRRIFYPFFLLLTATAAAQWKTDTLFYDEDGKETTKASAEYYRIIKKEKKKYRINDYYLNGQIYTTGMYSSLKPEKKEGTFISFTKEGIRSEEKTYKKNKLNGIYKGFYNNGNIRYEAFYKDGALNGIFKGYYRNGNIKRIDRYKKGKLRGGRCYTEEGRDTTYYPYMKLPSFEGGKIQLNNYIRRNLIYPEAAKRRKLEGTVYIRFVVEKNGEISGVRLQRRVNPLLDEQALYLVQHMPRWIPGSIDEEPYRFSLALPIIFKLDNNLNSVSGLE